MSHTYVTITYFPSKQTNKQAKYFCWFDGLPNKIKTKILHNPEGVVSSLL